jgi:hypothetical protein
VKKPMPVRGIRHAAAGKPAVSSPWSALLPDLWERQDGKCHWCGEFCLMWREARHVRGAKVENRRRVIQAGPMEFGVATVEHLVPRSAGGGHGGHNVVMACASCNHGRNERHQRDEAARVREAAAGAAALSGALRRLAEGECGHNEYSSRTPLDAVWQWVRDAKDQIACLEAEVGRLRERLRGRTA